MGRNSKIIRHQHRQRRFILYDRNILQTNKCPQQHRLNYGRIQRDIFHRGRRRERITHRHLLPIPEPRDEDRILDYGIYDGSDRIGHTAEVERFEVERLELRARVEDSEGGVPLTDCCSKAVTMEFG